MSFLRKQKPSMLRQSAALATQELFYQMSRMCRQKGAVKHDDRLDCLAQGVKYFTDALHISAQEEIKNRKHELFMDTLEAFLDDPQAATNHLRSFRCTILRSPSGTTGRVG